MRNENAPLWGTNIERGIVRTVDEATGACTVKSFDRDGVTTPPIKPINETVLNADDRVFFFMFDDGSGRIIGKMDD